MNDKVMAALGLAAFVLVLTLRLVAAPLQIDWDEELYFLIASGYQHGQLVYRDIFDHKPPAVYLLYDIGSGGGQSMAVLRWVFAALMGLSTWLFVRALPLPLSTAQRWPWAALLLAALSLFQGVSTNTEILYLPFLLITAAMLFEDRPYAAAVAAACALAIKYTVVLDLAGILLCCMALKPTPGAWLKRALPWALATALLSLALYLGFGLWLRAQGVDMLDYILFKNLAHSAGAPAKLFNRNSGLFEFVLICLPMVLAALVFTSPKEQLRKPALAILLWLLLSIVQALLTRRYYYHYFIPAFVPVLVWLMWQARGTRLSAAALACAALALALNANFVKKHVALNAALQADYRPQCELIRQGAYVLDVYLRPYRDCGATRVDRFAFPAFYMQDHFVALSGSGGMAGLRDKLASGAIPAVLMRQGDQVQVLTRPEQVPDVPVLKFSR